MPSFRRVLPTLSVIVAAACSAAGSGLDKLGETRRTSTTTEEAPAIRAESHTPTHSAASEPGSTTAVGTVVEGGDDSGATIPVDVAGSFLVLCSGDTQVSYLAAPSATDDTVACVLTDEDGAPVLAKSPVVKLRRPTGETLDVAMLSKETSAPWGFGFRLPVGFGGEAVVTFERDGKTETASTNRFDFRWLESALFGTFLKGLLDDLVIPASILGNLTAPPPQSPPNMPGSPPSTPPGLPDTEGRGASAIAFATAAEFDGAMSVAAADLECETRGTKIFGRSNRWLAALSTEAAPIASRFDDLSLGPVANLEGKSVAPSLDAFFEAKLDVAVLYDDRGLPVTAPLNAPPYDVTPPHYNAAVWAPLTVGCTDWSSATAPSLAYVADVTKTSPDWLRAGQRSCARKARILCIGFP